MDQPWIKSLEPPPILQRRSPSPRRRRRTSRRGLLPRPSRPGFARAAAHAAVRAFCARRASSATATSAGWSSTCTASGSATTRSLAKLTTLGHIDTELRALEDALHERRPVTVLREAGITACARCAAIHSSEDNFCPNCGLPMKRHVEVMADLRSGVPAPATVTPAASSPNTQQPPVAPVPAQQPSTAVPAPTPAPSSSPPPSKPAAGRSPNPPVAAAGSEETSVSRTTTTTAVEEDGPTEIISPSAPAS